jgi:hypothetical protein
MPIRHAFPFAYLCACHQTMRSLHTLNHLRQAFLQEKPHEHHATRSPKTMPPMFGRVAGRSKRRYDRMVGEGDQLNNWDYINNIRWIHLGSKLWITDSEVFERCSGESDILLGSCCLFAARSWSVFCPLLNYRQPSHPSVDWFYRHWSQARERIWKDNSWVNSWVKFYYANVLRSKYKDLSNITPKREKTLYNVSSKRRLEILSEIFRDSILIIITAELMVSD